MSHSPKSAIVHENIANGGTELEKKLLNLKSPFNDIDDVYLSSNFNELDRSSHVSVVMSERVQSIASGIYKEFETMIEAYGLPVVERLMPLIISLLENLDELYKDQSAYHAEVRQLREENEHIYDQLTAEKAARKQSELRLLNAEDAFDEERRVNEAKNESLSTSCRQTELRLQLAKDQVSRLEVKEQEWKKEENRLHEHLNELIRSNVELTEQIKFINNNNQDQSRNTLNNHIHKHSPRKLSMNSPKYNLTGSTNHDQSSTIDGSSTVHSNSLGVGYDATSGGFEFDELPNTLESESGGLNVDDDLPDTYPITINPEFEIIEFAGMRKEIDVLIKENMELVEMKNALNVVKDDLLARIDHLTSENISLRESVNMLTDSRVRLQSELTNIDQMLNEARTEINQLNEKLSFYQDKTNIESTNSAQVKRFTRSEMARILAERNHYKERLLELQDAVRFTETLRVSQKGHRELFMTKTPPTQQYKIDLNSPVSGPLQSLQKFFSSFTSGQRSENSNELIQNVGSDLSIHGTDNSLSWITLSATCTNSPIYGWVTGKQSDRKFSCNNNNNNNGGVVQSNSDSVDDNVYSNVPVPIQCRTIGGLHKKNLEICTSLTVPIASLDCNSKPKYHLWLIGRGSSGDYPNSNDSSLSLNRGYLGQVHIFEPTKFTQPINSFDLDNGFLPTAAVYVKYSEVASTALSSPESTSNHEYIEFTWDINESYDNSSNSMNETVCNKNNDGCVILASNDGRFLVFKLCYSMKSTSSSDLVRNNNDNEQIVSSHFNVVVMPQIIYRFNTNSQGLVANGMISHDNYVCIGLFNSLSTTHIVCFQWPLTFMHNQHNHTINTSSSMITSTLNKIQTKHKLINLPFESLSTGPLIMASSFSSSTSSSSNQCSTMNENNISSINDYIWLGTAGGGHCYCLAVQSGDFITSLALPNETPCLHAICVKPSTMGLADIVWLAVSGNPTICASCEKISTCTTDSNCNNVDNKDIDDDVIVNQKKCQHNVNGGISVGMARLLACCPKQKCILRQIDLTNSLSSMLDMENVTDPIDLTICRLLIIPLTSHHEIWFATRSGLIARLRLDYSKYKYSSNEVELSKPSSITISCHGYRRPVCNLLLIHQMNNNEDLNYLIVSVGHDYVDLRQIQEQFEQNDEHQTQLSADRNSSIRIHINRSRQMGSGAHAIVWRLTNLSH
ncbi:unnamed protein product [Schistosoma rodhaini]|uniref:RH1 domain-containing protein n=1 Tax=Schistosoma rodhaini TaxID=6188 RepID=A0AA85GDA4_9TREM|nr:unnamed protein product [Schistosoma rodhaini]